MSLARWEYHNDNLHLSFKGIDFIPKRVLNVRRVVQPEARNAGSRLARPTAAFGPLASQSERKESESSWFDLPATRRRTCTLPSKSKKLSSSEIRHDEEIRIRSGDEWTKRVNVDIPVWAIKELDREAGRRGITRQSLIKTWLIDRIDALGTKNLAI
jgi:hypothetical protein